MKSIFCAIFLCHIFAFSHEKKLDMYYETAKQKCHDISCIRSEIDRLNEEILNLITERTAYVKRAGDLKSKTSGIADDRQRVADQEARMLAQASALGLPVEIALPVFRSLMESSIAFQQKHIDSLAKEVFIELKDAKLFCRVIGHGKPLIVIHGGAGMSQDYLLPELYALAENNQVIFYDQRACGQSTGAINEETMTIPQFVEDLEKLRQAFHLDKVALLGHSWGGLIAMHYAIAHPDSVDKLILSNAVPACSDGRAKFGEEYLKRISAYQEEFSQITSSQEFRNFEAAAMDRFYRLVFKVYCHDPERTQCLNLGLNSVSSVNGAKVFQMFEKTAFKDPYDLHKSLKGLHIPTLVVHGQADPIPESTAQKIHESIPDSKYLLLKECGHFPFIEQNEAYMNALKTFLGA